MKKIALVTATRAEYGLLSPVIRELRKREDEDLRVELIVTGTHLSRAYGLTVTEIREGGTRIDHEIARKIAGIEDELERANYINAVSNDYFDCSDTWYIDSNCKTPFVFGSNLEIIF